MSPIQERLKRRLITTTIEKKNCLIALEDTCICLATEFSKADNKDRMIEIKKEMAAIEREKVKADKNYSRKINRITKSLIDISRYKERPPVVGSSCLK